MAGDCQTDRGIARRRSDTGERAGQRLDVRDAFAAEAGHLSNRTRKDATIDTRELARIAYDACVSKKGERIRLLGVGELTIVAEYFLICTAGSAPHAKAIAEEIRKQVREQTGRSPLGTEGAKVGWWVLVDYGDLVVHIFQADARSYYALDDTWADARVVSQSEPEAA